MERRKSVSSLIKHYENMAKNNSQKNEKNLKVDKNIVFKKDLKEIKKSKIVGKNIKVFESIMNNIEPNEKVVVEKSLVLKRKTETRIENTNPEHKDLYKAINVVVILEKTTKNMVDNRKTIFIFRENMFYCFDGQILDFIDKKIQIDDQTAVSLYSEGQTPTKKQCSSGNFMLYFMFFSISLLLVVCEIKKMFSE